MKAMKDCEQTKGLSIFAHGLSVNNYFQDLRNHILNKENLKYEWRLPDWIYNENLWSELENINDINQYQIFHDCGKPFCLKIDDEGKRHFPDHAKKSSEIWFNLTGNVIQSELIAHDMDIHLLKMDQFNEFYKLPYHTTLLITGLCEIHSNASMFGGIESDSFKIKWKKINKIGKKINELKEKYYE